jgi:hypothetical protein
MMTLLWIVLGLVALVIAMLALLYLNLLRASARQTHQLDTLVEPVFRAIAAKSPEAPALIESCAANPVTRNYLYEKLHQTGQGDLYPWQYYTPEKVAESDMVTWLMHPNELAAAPDAIELMHTLPVPGEGSYYLFRFRTIAPHWAADKGWLAGMSGPYSETDGQALQRSNTFSELKPFDEMTPEQHLEHLLGAIKSHAVARG